MNIRGNAKVLDGQSREIAKNDIFKKSGGKSKKSLRENEPPGSDQRFARPVPEFLTGLVRSLKTAPFY